MPADERGPAAATGCTCPEAVIRHEVPAERATFGFFLRRCYAEGRGKVQMAGLHAGQRQPRRRARLPAPTLPRAVLRNLGRRPGGRGVAHALRAGGVLAGIAAAGFGGAVETFAARRTAAPGRWRRPDERRRQAGPDRPRPGQRRRPSTRTARRRRHAARRRARRRAVRAAAHHRRRRRRRAPGRAGLGAGPALHRADRDPAAGRARRRACGRRNWPPRSRPSSAPLLAPRLAEVGLTAVPLDRHRPGHASRRSWPVAARCSPTRRRSPW